MLQIFNLVVLTSQLLLDVSLFMLKVVYLDVQLLESLFLLFDLLVVGT